MVRGTCRGLPPPSPVVTAMYCFPPIRNATGKPCTEVPRRVCQSTLPVFTSSARKLRSRSPANANPPPVGVRAGLHPFSDRRLQDLSSIGRHAGFRIDRIEDVLKDGFLVAEELAVGAIELPEDAGLPDREHELSGADIHQHAFVDFVE